MSEEFTPAVSSPPGLPRIVDGAFDMAALQVWLRQTGGGYGYRMPSSELEGLGIRKGDLLIGDDSELHYGDVAMVMAVGFDYDNADVSAVGLVVLGADGDPAMMVNGEALSCRPDAYSYVVPVIGHAPAYGHLVHFAEAKVLPRGDRKCVWPSEEAEERQCKLAVAEGEIPF